MKFSSSFLQRSMHCNETRLIFSLEGNRTFAIGDLQFLNCHNEVKGNVIIAFSWTSIALKAILYILVKP